MRVVFDTNVFVSAFITPGGNGDAAVRAALEGRVDLSVSVPLFTELANVLIGKFGWEREKAERAVLLVAGMGRVERPTEAVARCVHEPDNRILECAQAAGAQIIVTGDRHLLAIGTFGTARIATLAEFIESTDPGGNP